MNWLVLQTGPLLWIWQSLEKNLNTTHKYLSLFSSGLLGIPKWYCLNLSMYHSVCHVTGCITDHVTGHVTGHVCDHVIFPMAAEYVLKSWSILWADWWRRTEKQWYPGINLLDLMIIWKDIYKLKLEGCILFERRQDIFSYPCNWSGPLTMCSKNTLKCPLGWTVSAMGLGFESRLRLDSFRTLMALHCTELMFTLPQSWYDWNTIGT